MGVQVRGCVESLYAQLPEIMQRRPEAVLDVGEENVGAPEDQTARILNGSGEFIGQEVEDGSNVGGFVVDGEELGAEKGEPWEVGVGEALGFEVVDGDDYMVDGVGEWELVGFGLGVDDAERFEVSDVFAVGCTEFDEVGWLGWRRIER